MGSEVPAWWDADSRQDSPQGYGILDEGYRRQSTREVALWATLHCLRVPLAGLSSEEVEAVRVYTTDPEVYSKVTAMQFEGGTCTLIELLKEAIDKAALPEGVIAWRAAGYRLLRFPVEGEAIEGEHPDVEAAVGRRFQHRAFVSASLGNANLATGLGHYEVLYKLRVEAGVHALAVLDTWGRDQRELLVQAGVHYLIERVEQIRDIWFVETRVLSASGT